MFGLKLVKMYLFKALGDLEPIKWLALIANGSAEKSLLIFFFFFFFLGGGGGGVHHHI